MKMTTTVFDSGTWLLALSFCSWSLERGDAWLPPNIIQQNQQPQHHTIHGRWGLYGHNGDNQDDNKNIYDVAIIGSGPASCSLAALLTSDNNDNNKKIPKVVVLSKYADKRWTPNYGCWTDEWKVLDTLYKQQGVSGLMERGVDTHWKDTDCFFGEFDKNVLQNNPNSSDDEGNYRRTLGRAYLRVSRDGLKEVFYGTNDDHTRNYDVIRQDVLGKVVNTSIFVPRDAVTFENNFTELTLKEDFQKVKAKIVIDGTGAESTFTIRDDRNREGYQIAYGVECTVKGAGVSSQRVGDYDRSKMTLFDFRSEAWRDKLADSNNKNVVIQEPTFNYVMPLQPDVDDNNNNNNNNNNTATIFFEETSLVANPAMSFAECKDRLAARLESHKVEIDQILEEEFCYIPIGGGLPRKRQRIIPIGAASGLVHPSTGYQVGRALASNLDVADQIRKELSLDDESFDPDAAASRILGRIWTPEAIRQRNFAVFGGEFFMGLDVNTLKYFFAGFFNLEPSMWGGFLAGWKHLPGYDDHKNWVARLKFGLTALTKLPPTIALGMMGSIIQYVLSNDLGLDLIQSVTPLAGAPKGYEDALEFQKYQGGDLAAKKEAMDLLCNCDRCEEEAAALSEI